MPTRTIEIPLYTIDSHPHPDRCLDWMRENWHDLYAWQTENRESLEHFAEHFNIAIRDWQISTCRPSYVRIDVPFDEDNAGDDIATQLQLDKFMDLASLLHYGTSSGRKALLAGDCPFTGYCADEWLLDPIRAWMTSPDPDLTFTELMQQCVDAWAAAYVRDWEYAYSDEALRELAQANEYWFDEEGEVTP